MAIKGINKLRKNFNRISDNMQKRGKKAIKSTLIDVHSNILATSPVAKGYYRSNNFIEKGDVNTGKPFAERNQLNTRKNEAQQLQIDIKNGAKFTIYNPAPYADRIENGHSDQAPNGVYAPAFIRVRSIYEKNKQRFFK
jgi:hypothetical protein